MYFSLDLITKLKTGSTLSRELKGNWLLGFLGHIQEVL